MSETIIATEVYPLLVKLVRIDDDTARVSIQFPFDTVFYYDFNQIPENEFRRYSKPLIINVPQTIYIKAKRIQNNSYVNIEQPIIVPMFSFFNTDTSGDIMPIEIDYGSGLCELDTSGDIMPLEETDDEDLLYDSKLEFDLDFDITIKE